MQQQPRRRQDHNFTVSPSSRAPHHRFELGSQPYRRTRRYGFDPEIGYERNLSPPHRIDGVRRGVGVNKGGDGFERRDYDWHMGDRRGNPPPVYSRSPPGEQPRKRPVFDDGVRRRSCSPPLGVRPRYDMAKTREYCVDDESLDTKHVYGYDNVNNSMVNREKKLSDPRLGGGPSMPGHKLMVPATESEAQGSYGMVRDAGLTSQYKETNRHLPPFPRDTDTRRFELERPQQQRESLSSDKMPVGESYKHIENPVLHATEISRPTTSPSYMKDHVSTSRLRDHGNSPLGMSRTDAYAHVDDKYYSLSSDKMPAGESYKRVEKPILHATEVSRPTISPSYMKDHLSTSRLRDPGSSSLGMSRSDICSHHDGNHSPAYYEPPRGSGKLPETVGYSGYGQRSLMNTDRDAEPGQRNIGQQRSAFSPTMTEQEEYVNSKLHVAAQGERLYHDNLHRKIAPHERLDYEQTQVEYNNREVPATYSMNHVLDRNGKGEEQYDNHRRGYINDLPALQKSKYVAYHDISRTSNASKQHEDCLNSGYNRFESDNRMPREYEASYLDVSEAERSSIVRMEYESQRNRCPGLQQERVQNNLLTRRDSEAHGHATRVHDMKHGFDIYDHSDRQLKRKYNADDMYLSDSRTIKSYEWDAREEYQDPYEDEHWIDDEEMTAMYSSDNIGLDHKFYRKGKREYRDLDMVEDFQSDDWLSSHDQRGYVQQRSFRFRNYSNQNIKSHPRSNFTSWHKPHNLFKRNAFHKQPKVWKKNHGYDEIVHTNNDELSEDLTSATVYEPAEGSEEFDRKVQEAFLIYSKRLNVNSYVQRRYKGQGKAGSLFCIVCGRSSSKEFLDTQRLVTHAFMSHKVGKRVEHLGLHKAICVLLGWDTTIPQETVTWVPQVLPKAEALTQKEDLIIWPPVVVIHNVSMSDDNPQNWKVVSMEKVEAFIRGKGFVRGRINVCLGKPADQSVVLVKFVGTFVGLGDAERLNKYLSECKRGRLEFERIKSKTSRCSALDEKELEGDKMEGILYGYMGIAEDLDKLDFNSKKRCIIKSRNEIDQLDKDPVKANEKR